jgi:leader peptidase (prepilin peptidase)/N-methyltransferase
MMTFAEWWSVESGWGWLTQGGPVGVVALLFSGFLGLCLGSFLNVLIHRLPRDESVVWPGSHCPKCAHRLAVWENLPLVSFVMLGGRCRACRAAIHWRYPVVELVSALVMVGAVLVLGVGPATVGAALFVLALFAIAWIDAEHRIIPDELSFGLLAVGLLVRGPDLQGVLTALVGAALGFLALALVAVGYRRLRGRDGLGGGDVKLAAALGAFLGPPGLLLTIVLAALAGSLAGIALIASGRGSGATALPFGTFLAPAAVVVLVAGPALWRGYMMLAGL